MRPNNAKRICNSTSDPHDHSKIYVNMRQGLKIRIPVWQTVALKSNTLGAYTTHPSSNKEVNKGNGIGKWLIKSFFGMQCRLKYISIFIHRLTIARTFIFSFRHLLHYNKPIFFWNLNLHDTASKQSISFLENYKIIFIYVHTNK